MRAHVVDQVLLAGEIVFVRIDGNVPCDSQGNITNDYRLHAVMKTIKYVAQHADVTILGTHRGRPNRSSLLQEQKLSNEVLYSWFKKQGLDIHFYADIAEGLTAAQQKKHSVILLENLRFYEGEKNASSWLSEQIAFVATAYVNDAMSMLHRSDGSIVQLPLLLKKHMYGFRIQQELEMLQKFIDHPRAPYGLVLGGNKSAEKLMLLEKIMQKPVGKRPAFVLLGGLLALPFLVARDGGSYDVDSTLQEQARRIMDAAHNEVEIILPMDHQYENDQPIDIGKQTIALFKEYISKAGKIFVNGTMGKYEQESGAHGTKEIINSIVVSQAVSLIGGGNAVDAACRYGVIEQFSYMSVGGGATFAFLAAHDPWAELPGLQVLDRK